MYGGRPMSGQRAVATAMLTLAIGCQMSEPEAAEVRTFRPDSASRPIEPIPVDLDLDARKVSLGDALFHDPRLSHDDTVSCATCHDLSTGGCDRRPTSVGIGGAVGPINAPTVFNSGLQFRQFWDGRAESLEEQASGPVHAPIEMGSNWPEVFSKLREDPDFMQRFTAIYPDGLNAENITDAIATFERSLQTPNSRFDQFLNGDESALTEVELRGYRLFRDYGCVSCHQGVAIGGNMYQRFGVFGDYFAERESPTEADLGRFNTTGREADRHVFKVPTLRNIAVTQPYFHDGSAETLDHAVRIMARYQLGRELEEEEVVVLVAFLETLTGEYQGRPLQ